MADEIHHRKKSSAALKISLVVLGVLVLLGVIQAVTAGTVGVGALSVTLRETSSTVPTSRPSTSDDTAGLDGAVGVAPTTSSSDETSAESPVESAVLIGSWKQARGLLTVEVTKVENLGGRLKVFVTAINASTAKMELPVASVTAVDDVEREYGVSASTSSWPATIGKNSSTNGYLELDRPVGADSTSFSLTFGGIIGQLAPTGGEVTVTGIPVPR
jgi:hypothetical protein